MKTNTWIDKLLIAPALLISLFVVLIPGILTVVVSLTDWNGADQIGRASCRERV